MMQVIHLISDLLDGTTDSILPVQAVQADFSPENLGRSERD